MDLMQVDRILACADQNQDMAFFFSIHTVE